MKARAVVFTHVERPFALFGFPPALLGAAATGAMIFWIGLLMVGFASFAMLAAIAVFALELVGCHFLVKSDFNFVSVFSTTAKFWGMTARRWLLAGVPPSRSRGGRTK